MSEPDSCLDSDRFRNFAPALFLSRLRPPIAVGPKRNRCSWARAAFHPSDESLSPEFREWVIEFGSGAYLALYRYDGKEVVILAVRHGRELGYCPEDLA
jgi:hypothetical protein